MKNIIVSAILVAAMALTLASCGGDDKKGAETSGTAAATAGVKTEAPAAVESEAPATETVA